MADLETVRLRHRFAASRTAVSPARPDEILESVDREIALRGDSREVRFALVAPDDHRAVLPDEMIRADRRAGGKADGPGETDRRAGERRDFFRLEEPDPGVAEHARGLVVGQLADSDLEAARVIMRRLMWNLNDESGGIGWGSPEVMGEILAAHNGLAQEHAHILLSYARVEGNYLELEALQRGLLWGIGRLAEKRPDLVRGASASLLPHLESQDEVIRGLAARIMGLLQVKEALPRLRNLTQDDSSFVIMIGGNLTTVRVKDLAQEALKAMG